MGRFLYLFLLVIMMSFSTSGQSKSAIAQFQKAKEAFKQNDADKGWVHLEKAIKKGGNTYYQPLIFAGDRRFKEGDIFQAIEYYDKALQIQELSSIHLKKSIVYKYAGEFDLAIDSYQLYMKNARMSKERFRASELALENLKFTKRKYEEYMALGAPLEVVKLVFSDEKMEYAPSPTGDDRKLLFTARMVQNGAPTDENLFVAERLGAGWESRSKPVLGRVNTRVNEGASSISADGEYMVFTACNRPDGVGKCDLYYSYFDPVKGWGFPELLPGKINTKRWESQPTLGPDGTTLYFVRGSNNQSDDLDIMVAYKDDEGNWSTVEKLPSEVNSSGRERSPFIHFDGTTLYFVSERSPSIGGSDFFMVKRLSDSTWSAPENLGFPLNSFGDEFSLVVNAAGTHGYLSSNRGKDIIPNLDAMAEMDLYEFVLPEKMKPEQRLFKDFVVVHSVTQTPLGLANVKIKSLDEKEVYAGTSSKNTGLVRAMHDGANDLRISAYKKGFLPYSAVVSKDDLMDATTIYELPLTPLKSADSFVLRNLLFDTDKSELLAAGEQELRLLKKLLIDNPSLNATIVGHTDNQGGRSYNQKLSEDRATAVLEWLIDSGIESGRINAQGEGMDKPVATNDTEEGRALNRRTEVQLR
ncbi:MAG: Outer membrane porin F [Cryomorphaceae bacterium]|nr:MAG: Outer membrane porin F [Cryomorphaceae bacterium]